MKRANIKASNKKEKTPENNRKRKLREKAKDVRKFPAYYKGYLYKPYMKGSNLYIDVVKMDNRSKKTTYKICKDQLMMVSSTMPMNMHAEYGKVLNKNITGILMNLKWYKLLLYRVTGLFRKIGGK